MGRYTVPPPAPASQHPFEPLVLCASAGQRGSQRHDQPTGTRVTESWCLEREDDDYDAHTPRGGEVTNVAELAIELQTAKRVE